MPSTTKRPALPSPLFDERMLREFLRLVMPAPGTACVHLECFNADFKGVAGRCTVVPSDRYSKTIGGWYDDINALIADAKSVQLVSAYLTINPVARALLAQKCNGLAVIRKDMGTHDKHIELCRWLYIDIDAERPGGISATEEEVRAALAKRDRILAENPDLAASSIWGCSGNGAWILVYLGDQPNDEASYKLRGRALEVLAQRYGLRGRDPVFIDPKTKNAARVMCLPGTLKCKGDHIEERPWRMVTLDSQGEFSGRLPNWRPAAFDLTNLVGTLPAPQANGYKVPVVPAVNGHAGRPGYPVGGRPEPAERARRVIFAPDFPNAIAGQNGHDTLFRVGTILWNEFGLPDSVGFPIFVEWNAAKAIPPESEAQVRHKWESVKTKYPVPSLGMLREDSDDWEPPHRPGMPGQPAAPEQPPVDAASLDARATKLIEDVGDQLDRLYRDDAFLSELARLELDNPVEAEAIKAKLGRIKGWKERAFQRVMAAYRVRLNTPMTEDGDLADGHPGGAAPEEHDLTDLGNAYRLVAEYGSQIAYCKAYSDWMIYDGRRWAVDKRLSIEGMAKAIPGLILAEIGPTRDQERIKRFREHADRSQSRERLEAAVKVARSLRAVEPTDLDRNPWLLNCQNGTIDLKTFEFRSHRPADMLTKMTAVSYDAEAKAPRWRRFISEIMDGDEGMAGYLQRAIGYSITGVIREHVFFVLHGTGRNGKTSLLNTIFALLGDYANQVDSELMLAQTNQRHPTELTELEGRRFVSADECDDDRRLAEGQIKKLTGGNPIQARRMYGNFYTFPPSHHLFFAVNHKPDIRHMDPAIWRRVKLLPFEVSFDLEIPGGRRPDLELEDKLLDEGPGILNWMLEGCRRWQAEGLSEPNKVTRSVANYKAEMDTLGDFIMQRCIRDPKARVEFSILYTCYVAWCAGWNILKPWHYRTFTSKLTDIGFPSQASNSLTYKLGLRLRTADDPDPPETDLGHPAGGESLTPGTNRVKQWFEDRDADDG